MIRLSYRWRRSCWFLVLVCFMFHVPGFPLSAQTPRAPELDGGVGWIGSDRPLRLQDFRGKFVILDFWTLC